MSDEYTPKAFETVCTCGTVAKVGGPWKGLAYYCVHCFAEIDIPDEARMDRPTYADGVRGVRYNEEDGNLIPPLPDEGQVIREEFPEAFEDVGDNFLNLECIGIDMAGKQGDVPAQACGVCRNCTNPKESKE